MMKWLILFCALSASAQISRLPYPIVSSKGATTSAYNPATDANVVEWLKADGQSYSNDDPVSPWVAGTGNNATNGGTARPTYKTNAKNGLAVIRFDGINDSLGMADLSSVAQPFTVLIVYVVASTTADQYVLAPNTTAGGRDIRFGTAHSSAFAAYAGNGSDVIDIGSADTNWHILQIIFNGASSSYRFDGGTRTTFSATPGGDAFLGFTLANYPSGGFVKSCDIGEIIVRNTGSTSQETAIFSYLNGRWAVY